MSSNLFITLGCFILRACFIDDVLLSNQMMFLVTVTGTLKGYDQLLNLVLDEAVEFLRGKSLQTIFSWM